MSARQGMHHVAQKSSKTNLPRNSEILRGLPVKSTKSNSISLVSEAFAMGKSCGVAVLAGEGVGAAVAGWPLSTTSTFVSNLINFGGRQVLSLHVWKKAVTTSVFLPGAASFAISTGTVNTASCS